MRGLFWVFRALFVGLVFGFTALSTSFTASAKAIEIKSENFVLVGNVRETDGKALLLELEQYRQAILQILGVRDPIPEIIPVRIYTVSGDKQLKLLTGRTDIGGVYTSTIEGPVFILNSKGGFRRGKQARHIALHEFTHHILAAYTNQVYPLWYNEGLANYFATFEVNNEGDIIIGRPNNPYAYALSSKTWMPTNVLVNSVLAYPFKSTGRAGRGLTAANYFYAQSWLAVHYIQSVEGENAKLNEYIKLLNAKRGSFGAFEKAFGRTPEEFEVLLKAYYKKNRYKAMTIKLKAGMRNHTFQVRKLDKPMAEFHKAEAMRFFSSNNVKTAQIVAQYDKAAKSLGETPEILSARADLATWENDYAKAESYINKARAQKPDDPHILRMSGMVLFYKNRYAVMQKTGRISSPQDSIKGRLSTQELEQARTYLKQAMIKNPDDIAAHYYFAQTFTLMYEIPSAQALASAETALDYYRSTNAVQSNLGLAEVLIRGRKYQLALPAVNKAIIWGRNGAARMQAQTMKRIIERQG